MISLWDKRRPHQGGGSGYKQNVVTRGQQGGGFQRTQT